MTNSNHSTEHNDNERVFQDHDNNGRDTPERNNVEQNFNERDINDHIEQDEFNEEYDHNSWTATGPMTNLPTNIFKKNFLSSSSRKSIL